MPDNLDNLFNFEHLHEHISESFERLAPMVEREHQKRETPVNVTMPMPDMERLAHPAEDQLGEMQVANRDLLEEFRALWKEQLSFMRAFALEHIQTRIELNDIRAKFERER